MYRGFNLIRGCKSKLSAFQINYVFMRDFLASSGFEQNL